VRRVERDQRGAEHALVSLLDFAELEPWPAGPHASDSSTLLRRDSACAEIQTLHGSKLSHADQTPPSALTDHPQDLPNRKEASMFLKLVPAVIGGSLAIGGASIVVPALGQARVGRCASVYYRYSDHGTSQYTLASSIRI
jgi:hypothetical protein